MARGAALAAATAVSLLAVSGAGGVPEQTPKRGGTVVYGGTASEPTCLAPFLDVCAPGVSARGLVLAKVLEAPFDIGPDLEWRARLVSRVDFTKEPPFTLTYHVRPEARWSDGTPITASDFVFTHEAIRKHGSPDHPNRTGVRSVRALDAKTVRVVLRDRLGAWRGLFGNILPSHALKGADLAAIWRGDVADPRTGRPIGSGPFLVERWERGKQITLVRNPRYWGRHSAHLDRIVVRFQAPTALFDAFRAGELDVAASWPIARLTDFRQEPGTTVLLTRRSPAYDHFEIRIGPGGHPALRDKLVRRALAYGIDRAAIARRAHDLPLLQQDSAVFVTGTRYYRSSWGAYEHRPSESRRLLEEAGCGRGSDLIYVCAGERLSFRFAAIPTNVFRVRVVELAQAQLREVGVEVVPTFASRGVLFDQILPSGNFDVALFAWVLGPDPELKPIFGCGGPDNYTGYCQRLTTSDLDQANRIFDADKRALVLNRADRRIAKDAPIIPLYVLPQNVALRSTLKNFRWALNASVNPLWNAENWWLER